MQYLLTAEELKALNEKKELHEISQTGKLQELCTLAANHIPVVRPWMGEDAEPEPWGCILDKETDPGYCDDCPMDEACPWPSKHWSK